MYSVDGDFGKVRLVAPAAEHRLAKTAFWSPAAGWHRCNELYHIERGPGVYECLLLFTVRGEGRLRLNGKEIPLRPDSIALIPRHWPNEYRTAPGQWWEFYWIHTTGEAANRLADGIVEDGTLVTAAGAEACAPLVEDVLRIAGEKRPGYQWELSATIGTLLHRVGAAMQVGRTGGKSGFAEQVAEYLEKHCSEPLPLQAVAEKFFVSESHLIRRFRKETGMTPHEYLLRSRIGHAKRLLQFTGFSVDEIAAKTGFCSASHFVSSFRRSCGVTPAVWRRTNSIL